MLPAADAASLIFGYAVGIDLTRRDLQAEAKKAGRPWDMAKGFDHSAPIGALATGIPPGSGAITLSVDGKVRQSGDLKDMIWSVAEIIAALSTYVEVAPGDLIFTGTPAGVGPIQRGESVRGMIAGIEPIEITFEPSAANLQPDVLRRTACCALGVMLCVPLAARAADDYQHRVEQVLLQTPLIDGHNDLPWEIRERFKSDLAAVDLRSDTATCPSARARRR